MPGLFIKIFMVPGIAHFTTSIINLVQIRQIKSLTKIKNILTELSKPHGLLSKAKPS